MTDISSLTQQCETIFAQLPSFRQQLGSISGGTLVFSVENGVDYCIHKAVGRQLVNGARRYLNDARTSVAHNDLVTLQRLITKCSCHVRDCKDIAEEALGGGGWVPSQERRLREKWRLFAFNISDASLLLEMPALEVLNVVGRPEPASDDGPFPSSASEAQASQAGSSHSWHSITSFLHISKKKQQKQRETANNLRHERVRPASDVGPRPSQPIVSNQPPGPASTVVVCQRLTKNRSMPGDPSPSNPVRRTANGTNAQTQSDIGVGSSQNVETVIINPPNGFPPPDYSNVSSRPPIWQPDSKSDLADEKPPLVIRGRNGSIKPGNDDSASSVISRPSTQTRSNPRNFSTTMNQFDPFNGGNAPVFLVENLHMYHGNPGPQSFSQQPSPMINPQWGPPPQWQAGPNAFPPPMQGPFLQPFGPLPPPAMYPPPQLMPPPSVSYKSSKFSLRESFITEVMDLVKPETVCPHGVRHFKTHPHCHWGCCAARRCYMN